MKKEGQPDGHHDHPFSKNYPSSMGPNIRSNPIGASCSASERLNRIEANLIRIAQNTTIILSEYAPRRCPELALRNSGKRKPTDNGLVTVDTTKAEFKIICGGVKNANSLYPCNLCSFNKATGGVTIPFQDME